MAKYFWLVDVKGRSNIFLMDGWMVDLGVSKNRGKPQNGWFIMENPIKMDDLGVPLFLETPMLM